jgi:two-component system, chemotaxis family, CheB/CheR fusion protein
MEGERSTLQNPLRTPISRSRKSGSTILAAGSCSVDGSRSSSDLAGLYQAVQEATGVDFSGYKPATINRRIGRRMAATKIEALGEYVRYLDQHPTEIQALYQDLLIPVTSFFRDPEAFAALEKIAFPALFQDRTPNDTVRVWVPGCSTGEEAYSHVICLVEYIRKIRAEVSLRVFGTDVNETAIRQARAGIFKEGIRAAVSPARLQQFFTTVEGGYKVNKTIRDLCIFARQNLLADPPFSRMDIVSCRNVLIYLRPAMQRTAIAALHYALKPNGYLMLGLSEAPLGADAKLFEALDACNRIYKKKRVASPALFWAAVEGFANSGGRVRIGPSNNRHC